MPDWSYATLFAPGLRRLPGHRARDLTLGAIGALAAAPGGTLAISLVGHMQPPSGSATDLGGVHLPSPVAVSGDLDPRLLGTAGLARLGIGLLEIGPVTVEPVPEITGPCLDARALVLADAPIGPGLTATRQRLDQLGKLPVPLAFRVSAAPKSTPAGAERELAQLIDGLSPWAAIFILETRWSVGSWSPDDIHRHTRAVRRLTERPLYLVIPPDAEPNSLDVLVRAGLEAHFDGWVVAGGLRLPDGRRVVGPQSTSYVRSTVSHIRQMVAPDAPLLAEGGVEEPADALRLTAAGANVVLLHSGLIVGGPGLPKRINEAFAPTEPAKLHGSLSQWLPLVLLGLGMVVSGSLAWTVAVLRVVLPYDETFLGLSRDALPSINARLLAFMAHDRVTLAGTMLSIGVLYAQLGYWGARLGAHWAWLAVVVSTTIGFVSFFLFLGFGYFDPLHAAVSVVLLLLFLPALRAAPGSGETGHAQPGLYNDLRWKLSLWGQLCFVALGVGLIGAGVGIALIGIGGVLVPEDVHFLETPAAVLRAANPRLLPLVAHDRAGFGGALISDGLGVLLTSLWGYRAGARWLWWTLLGAGLPGFTAALGVHIAVGYLDSGHLAPAVLGAAVFCAGLVLSYPYLCSPRTSVRSHAERDRGRLAEAAPARR